MPSKIRNPALLCSIVLFIGCFHSHEKGHQSEVVEDDNSSDGSIYSQDFTIDSDEVRWKEADAGSLPLESGEYSQDATTNNFSLVGAWQGTFEVLYSNSTILNNPNNAIPNNPSTIYEFTDTEVIVLMSGVEIGRIGYNVYDSQMPHQFEIELFDPLHDDVSITCPATYESENNAFIIALWDTSLYSDIPVEVQMLIELTLFKIP